MDQPWRKFHGLHPPFVPLVHSLSSHAKKCRKELEQKLEPSIQVAVLTLTHFPAITDTAGEAVDTKHALRHTNLHTGHLGEQCAAFK